MVFIRDAGSWRVALALVVATGVVSQASVGQAEDVDAISKKGTELRRQGRDAEALVEFQRAARIQDSPRASAQVALAEQALGLWPDANTHLGRALRHGNDPWIQKNRAALDAALRTIQEHLCEVEVWGAPAGAEVLIDGKRVGSFPTASTWLVPGDVPLQVKASGYSEALRTLKAREGGHIREHVDLRALAAPVAATRNIDTDAAGTKPAPGPSAAAPEPVTLISRSTGPTPATDNGGPPIYRRWWFWTLVGAGAIAAGGTTTWLVTHRGTGTDTCMAPCSTW